MKSSKPSNRKRQRRLNAWDEAKRYIHKKGGFIHEDIEFSSPSSPPCHDENCDDKEQNEHLVKVIPSSSSSIQKGDVIMRIPTNLLITLSTAEKSSFGPPLFRLVDGIDSLYNSKNDVLLALYLSFVCSRSNANSNSASNPKSRNGNPNDVSINEDEDLVHLYLATLPDNQSYNNLPRRWDDEKITKYLTGTSVIHRIQNEKIGLANDYKILKERALLMESNGGNDKNNEKKLLSLTPFPTYDIFDQMIAAVSSRAFDNLGDDQLEALVILLDLFNHKRGVSSKTTSDISYVRSKQVTEGGERRGDYSSSIIVTAKRDLKTGSIPSITYGAKGNSQLLLRYGFTLDNNVEPDGSSNDIVEFYSKPNGEMVELKRGPKAYTYGCFVKALEMYLNTSDKDLDRGINDDNNHDSHSGNNANDDMEDFLNSCEEQQGIDDMFGCGGIDDGQFAVGLYNDDNDTCGLEEGESSDNITLEIEAINNFIIAIQNAREKYTFSGNELSTALKGKTSSCEYFCALLIISEMKTLDLYDLASMLVRRKLETEENSSDHAKDDIEKFKSGLDTKYGNEEGQKVKAFATELADTYYKIRHEANS